MINPLQDQIDTLLARPQSVKEPAVTLGRLCARRAVAGDDTDKSSSVIRLRVPTERDWNDLKTLLGERRTTQCMNYHQAETDRFLQGFRDGIADAIKGQNEVSDACDGLGTMF